MAKATFSNTFPASGDSITTSSNWRAQFQSLYQGDKEFLRPRAHDNADLRVAVLSSQPQAYFTQVYMSGDFALNMPSGDSTALVAPASGSKKFLLYTDGTNLTWISGDTIPAVPASKLGICVVHVPSTATKIVNYEDRASYPNDAYIQADVRPFLNLGGKENFSNLLDVNLSSIASGDIVRYNGSKWVNTVKGTATQFLAGDGVYRTPVSGGLQNSRILYTGGDFSTTSASFVDIDATNAAITITTGANPVLIGFGGRLTHATTADPSYIDIDIDGTRQGGTNGLIEPHPSAIGIRMHLGYVYQTVALSAGSHTFKMQWFTAGGTINWFASATAPFHMWVTEAAD